MTVFLVPNVYVFQMAPHTLLLFSSIIVWIRPLQHFSYYLQHNGSTSIVVILFISHTFPPTVFFYFTCFLPPGLLLGRQEVRTSAELLTEMRLKLSQYFAWRRMGTGGVILLVLHDGGLTRCRSAVSVTPRPLYLLGKSLFYSLSRRLGGPSNRSEGFGKI
jgi:hypothetical protein